NLVYVPSQLTASLTGELRREIALADIDAVDAVQPTAAASGRIVISFADTKNAEWAIAFAPNQDAQGCAEWINDVRSGKITEDHSSPGAVELQATATPGLDFVAVDVETANGNWASICQIGAVRFVNGE